MTESEIFERLRPYIKEVTGAKLDAIRMDSVLVGDLGAESIDLLDLSFLIEEHFGVTIEANELEKEARKRIPDGAYERDGYLTDAALAELRAALPDIDPAKLAPGLKKVDLPALLPVSVFVRIIQRKLAAKGDAKAEAQG